MQKTLSAGDPVEARCTKCRKITNHIVIAMTETVPAKVECNVCSGQHKYRPPVAEKKPAVRRSTGQKSSAKQQWETLRPEMDRGNAKAYSMDASYQVNSLVSHPLFGLGVVQRIIGSQKMEVLFEVGMKTMRCK
ncbi:MAG: hypothetical protein RQ754_00185 [Desulfuromonadales bacterium]|jgi:hypothetical protein|nr:hypothetical protein [Desulfuromonadales bacterium]